MEKALEIWVRNVRECLGNDLSGIILYGSVLKGNHIPRHSDVNLMLIFKKMDLAKLTEVGSLIRKHLAKHSPRLICWTREELKNAWDVFPLEFEDLVQNHRCLAGEDPFLKSKVGKKNLRFQLEFELRSKLLALRSAWLRLNHNRMELEAYLVHIGSSLNYLFQHATTAFNIKAAVPAGIFEKIQQLKKKQLRLKLPGLQSLCGELHTALESLIRKIDAA